MTTGIRADDRDVLPPLFHYFHLLLYILYFFLSLCGVTSPDPGLTPPSSLLPIGTAPGSRRTGLRAAPGCPLPGRSGPPARARASSRASGDLHGDQPAHPPRAAQLHLLSLAGTILHLLSLALRLDVFPRASVDCRNLHTLHPGVPAPGRRRVLRLTEGQAVQSRQDDSIGLDSTSRRDMPVDAQALQVPTSASAFRSGPAFSGRIAKNHHRGGGGVRSRTSTGLTFWTGSLSCGLMLFFNRRSLHVLYGCHRWRVPVAAGGGAVASTG